MRTDVEYGYDFKLHAFILYLKGYHIIDLLLYGGKCANNKFDICP